MPRPARLVVDGLDEHRSATQNGDLLLFPADDGGLAGNVLPAGAGGVDSTSEWGGCGGLQPVELGGVFAHDPAAGLGA